MIIKPKNAVAFRSKEGISTRTALEMLGLEMLPAVDLDHQIRCVADEIDDIGPDRRLAPEARTNQTMSTYRVPDDPLCFR